MKKLKTFLNYLTSQPFKGFIEYVPAYNNITIYYNPYVVHISQNEFSLTAFEKVSSYMNELVQQMKVNKKERF